MRALEQFPFPGVLLGRILPKSGDDRFVRHPTHHAGPDNGVSFAGGRLSVYRGTAFLHRCVPLIRVVRQFPDCLRFRDAPSGPKSREN